MNFLETAGKIKGKIRLDFSSVALIFVCLFSINAFHKYSIWEKRNTFAWDAGSYYWYLPATFVYADLALHFTDGKEGEFNAKHQYFAERAENGSKVNRYTMGSAVLNAPFFLTTLAIDKLNGNKIEEYGTRYQFTICLASLFYAMAGLFFLRLSLLTWFNPFVTGIALIAASIGTNFLYYATMEGTMSHIDSFFLFSVFLWLTIKWHSGYRNKHLILLGIVSGLIFLVRPTNCIVVLFFLFYDVHSIASFKTKLKTLFGLHWRSTVAAILCGLLVVAPQFIYWKTMSGHWFFYGYMKERFFFNNPHVLEGLFSYRKGWVVYSPVMFFTLAGLYFVWKNKSVLFALPVFFLINLYILFSWWSWWYAGGFGQRALIDSLPLMMIAWCCFMQWIWESRHLFFRYVFLAVAGFAVYLSHFMTTHYIGGGIHYDSMTKQAYWSIFLKKGIPENYHLLLKAPDNEKALRGEDEYEFDVFD